MMPKPALIAAALALVTLSTTACAPEGPTAEALADVVLAAEKTGQQSYRLTMTITNDQSTHAGFSADSVVDPVAERAHTTNIATNVTMESVIIGADVWFKSTIGSDRGGWVHKTWEGGFGPALSDNAVDPVAYLKTAKDVEESAENTYRGLLDLSATPTNTIVVVALPGRPADELKAIAFTATLDDDGRLALLEITAGTDTFVITLSDHGAPVDVAPPPADQVEELPEK